MSLNELKKQIESDSLVQSRTVDVSLTDGKLSVKEYGNPALEVDDTPSVVETGETHLSNRVQDIATEVLGYGGYKCRVYEDPETSETDIIV